MATPNVFDLYQAKEEEKVPQLRRKSSRRHNGETSQGPPAKKGRTKVPPKDMPTGQTSAQPSTPAEKQTPPAPSNPPAAPTREQNKWEETLGAKLSSHALRAAKDRLAHIVKNDRIKNAMVEVESMGVDQILNRTLNEIASVSTSLSLRP